VSSNFGLTFTRNDLIKAVLRALGVIGQTQSPSPEDFTFCSEALNLMIKSWVNKGATLWKIQEIIVKMVSGIPVYPIGSNGGYISSIIVNSGGSGYLVPPGVIITGGGGNGASAISVISGGVVTEVKITAVGTGFTTAPAITFSSGLATATALLSRPSLNRVQRILDQGNFIRNDLTSYDQPIYMISRTDYNNLGNKSINGTVPSQFWYDPAFNTTINNGYLSVYTVPGPGINHSMHLMGQIIYDDTTAVGDLFDFPQEFLNAMKWGLAWDVLAEYGVDATTEARIEKRYQMYSKEAFDFSVEESSCYFSLDSRMR
jgi:hypothetical protein